MTGNYYRKRSHYRCLSRPFFPLIPTPPHRSVSFLVLWLVLQDYMREPNMFAMAQEVCIKNCVQINKCEQKISKENLGRGGGSCLKGNCLVTALQANLKLGLFSTPTHILNFQFFSCLTCYYCCRLHASLALPQPKPPPPPPPHLT